MRLPAVEIIHNEKASIRSYSTAMWLHLIPIISTATQRTYIIVTDNYSPQVTGTIITPHALQVKIN